MALDFLDVGGVKLLVLPDTWKETRAELGDVATNGGLDSLAMSGRPIETRSALCRLWSGRTPRNLAGKELVSQANAPAHFEKWMRWIEGWGQHFLCNEAAGVPIAASGLALTPLANLTWAGAAMSVNASALLGFTSTYSMRQRGGWSETLKAGWTFGFKRTFIAGETVAAGSHWCVGTGAVAFAQASGNPAGVTQYVDGAPANFSMGNVARLTGGQASVYGFKTDGVTGSAIVYSSIFLVPFQMPASWISQIWTNVINAGINFPSLPRQRLSGQWLINDNDPVEAIGRVGDVTQAVGSPAGQTFQADLRELSVAFVEY